MVNSAAEAHAHIVRAAVAFVVAGDSKSAIVLAPAAHVETIVAAVRLVAPAMVASPVVLVAPVPEEADAGAVEVVTAPVDDFPHIVLPTAHIESSSAVVVDRSHRKHHLVERMVAPCPGLEVITLTTVSTFAGGDGTVHSVITPPPITTMVPVPNVAVRKMCNQGPSPAPPIHLAPVHAVTAVTV